MPLEISITLILVVVGALCWAVLIAKFNPIDTYKPPKKSDGQLANWYWEQSQKQIQERIKRDVERHLRKGGDDT